MSQTEVQLIKDAVIVNADISNSAAIDVSKISGALPAAGGTITGDVTFDGETAGRDIVFDRSDNSLEFADNAKAIFGTGNDLQIYHDGSHSRIKHDGTGILSVLTDGWRVNNAANNESFIRADANGAVELYYDSSKKFETTSTGVQITSNALFPDSGVVQLGASQDLRLYHDGTNSIISNQTGILFLLSDDLRITNLAGTENLAKFTADGAVELYHDNTVRLTTNSTGLTIGGGFTTTHHCAFGGNILFDADNTRDIGSGSARARNIYLYQNLDILDNGQIRLGNSDDLLIYHDGTDSRIVDSGTGRLVISSNTVQINNAGNTDVIAKFIEDGAVELYYDNSKKLETKAGGVQVHGNLMLDSDNDKAIFGAGNDLQIYHDGTDSIIGNATGTFQFLSPNEIRYRATTHSFLSYGNDETMAKFNDDGAVELYHNNVKKFETTTEGFAVKEGNTTRLSLTYSNSLAFITANAGNEIKVSSGNGNSNGIEFWDYTGVNKRCQIDAEGIKFNTDTAAANGLDDYEEGTFTPSFGFSNDNFNGSYSAQGGAYTKIGNIVNVRFQIAATKGTGTGGTATVYNLPFTPVNADNYRASGVMGYYEGFTSDKPILILVEQNQTQFPFRHSGDTNAQSIGAANMSSSFRFYISITYQVA